MSDGEVDISIVLPVGGAEGISMLEPVLNGYAEWLDTTDRSWEMLIVPASEHEARVLATALDSIPASRLASARDTWGAAVREGLRVSGGKILCYTNWRRTSTDALAEMLDLSLRNEEVVLRANRRTRDTRVGRMGSLLFNIECRLLLNVPAWDVNGTPKIFHRHHAALLDLRQDGDLIDAEFAVVCERSGYPVIEVPVEASLHPGVPDSFRLGSAAGMYLGVVGLR